MRFADIAGHNNVKEHLRTLVDSDRVPHALLLSGPEGTGKLALARALAQYMHCVSPVNGDSCGRCPSCVQHASLNNADMHFVYPIVKSKQKHQLVSTDMADAWRNFLSCGNYASWQRWLDIIDAGNSRPGIYVEESAEILRKLNISNFSARYKVMVVWLPEKLQGEAANKLLKIIEEPFDDTKFIFVSNDPASILPTILSRLQRVAVTRLSDDEIAAILVDTRGVDPQAAVQLAYISDGNACTALDAVETAGEFDEFMELFQDIMRKAYMRDVKALRDNGDTVAAMGREKSLRFLAYCARMVRENFIYNLGRQDLVRLTGAEARFSSRFAPFINAANADDMMRLFDEAAADISRNANAKIVMFDTLLHLIVLILRK